MIEESKLITKNLKFHDLGPIFCHFKFHIFFILPRMVRLEVKPRSAEQTGLHNESLLVRNPTGRGHPRSRPTSGQ